MFQPAGTTAEREKVDFDLWRSMAREYSEELLGAAEHDNVDYDHWPFFHALAQARAAGHCRPYLLGVGVDPLTLATDILTVTVFDAAAFDTIFTGLIADNAEGRTTIRDADGLFGTAFTSHQVGRLTQRDRMQPAGAATLHLAWRYRRTLLSH